MLWEENDSGVHRRALPSLNTAITPSTEFAVWRLCICELVSSGSNSDIDEPSEKDSVILFHCRISFGAEIAAYTHPVSDWPDRTLMYEFINPVTL